VWNREADELLRVILGLSGLSEARRFFRDLMTEDEIRMIVDRWRVARMLHEGSTYRQIESATGLSSRTIARISRWLQEGEGGYRRQLAHHSHHSHRA
jgi:TrpR-related protein YerC/YecD